MTSRVHIAGSWDFAALGTCTYTLTDSAGAHAPFSFSSGYYDHRYCLDASATVTGMVSFSTAFQAALNLASPTKTYAVGFNNNAYTITVNAGTFSIATTGAYATTILGDASSTIASVGTSYSSAYTPWFCITPAKPGLSNYVQPTQASGATKESVSSDGSVYVLSPTRISRVCSWEHHFEPKYMVDRDARGSTLDVLTQLYSWEQLWDDYRTGLLPIGLFVEFASGSYEEIAFSLMTREYDKSVVQRRSPSDDFRFTVKVAARLWAPATTSSGFARTFNV